MWPQKPDGAQQPLMASAARSRPLDTSNAATAPEPAAAGSSQHPRKLPTPSSQPSSLSRPPTALNRPPWPPPQPQPAPGFHPQRQRPVPVQATAAALSTAVGYE